jgi:hypothetical protein
MFDHNLWWAYDKSPEAGPSESMVLRMSPAGKSSTSCYCVVWKVRKEEAVIGAANKPYCTLGSGVVAGSCGDALIRENFLRSP